MILQLIFPSGKIFKNQSKIFFKVNNINHKMSRMGRLVYQNHFIMILTPLSQPSFVQHGAPYIK